MHGSDIEEDDGRPGLVIVRISAPQKLKNKTNGTRRWLFYIGYEGHDTARCLVVYYRPDSRKWQKTWANGRKELSAEQLLQLRSLPLPKGRLTIQHLVEHIPKNQFAEAIAAAMVYEKGKR